MALLAPAVADVALEHELAAHAAALADGACQGGELGEHPIDHRRETQDLARRIQDDREDGLRSDQVRILPSFFMLDQDIEKVHFLRHPKGREADVRRQDRFVGERRSDPIEVMDPDGDLPPLPADGHVKFLLEIDDGP